MSSKRSGQVSVPLTAEQLAFVERTAEREDRTIAATIRHFVAEAARRSQQEQSAAA